MIGAANFVVQGFSYIIPHSNLGVYHTLEACGTIMKSQDSRIDVSVKQIRARQKFFLLIDVRKQLQKKRCNDILIKSNETIGNITIA